MSARYSTKDWVDELADEQLNLGEFPANESRPVSQTGGISEFPAILFIFETEGKDVGSIIFSLVIFELGLGFSFLSDNILKPYCFLNAKKRSGS